MDERAQPLTPVWPAADALLTLLDELRLAGYNIGIDQYIAVQDLLLALAERGELLADPHYLRRYLGPLLCSNAAEQGDFQQRFDLWLTHLEVAAQVSTEEQAATFDRDLGKIAQKTLRFRCWGLVSLMLVIGLVIYIYLNAPTTNSSPTPIPQEVATPLLIVTSSGSFPSAGAVSSLTSSIQTMTTSVAILTTPTATPAITNSETIAQRTWWDLTWFTLALLLTTIAVWQAWWFYQAKLFLVRRATTVQPDLTQIALTGVTEGLFATMPLMRLAQEFRRRISSPSADLDVGRTLTATIRHGGWFTPIYGSRLTSPEYLVLVDRTTSRDQQASFVNAVIDQLVEQNIYITIYYFEGDPRRCFSQQRRIRPFTLQELINQHPGQRLLIFADAEHLFNPIHGGMEAWIELFMAWPQRALMTPEPPEHWGQWEEEVSEYFAVFPASVEGLAYFVRSLQIDAALGVLSSSESTPLPSELRTYPRRWLQRDPVEPMLLEKVLDGLRRYLGVDGYYWLSACAVYPELHWNLTLYLGNVLEGVNNQPLFDPSLLLTLTRLPWFRHGSMPDWLRARLVADLPHAQDRSIRTALQTLLASAMQGEASTLTLTIARRHHRTLRALSGPLLRLLGRQAPTDSPDSPLREFVFMNFMAGWWQTQLAVRLPHALYRLVRPPVAQNTLSSFAKWRLSVSALLRIILSIIATKVRSVSEWIVKSHIRTALLTLLLATLVGLLSNIVANYLPPLFDERRWLAIGLFILVIGASGLLDLYQRGLWSPWGDRVPGLERTARTELLAILTPLMADEQERRVLLDLALYNHPLYHDIDFSGAARPFTIRLLRQLAADPPSFAALLEVAHDQVGVEQQARLQALQAHIRQPVVTKPISFGMKVGTGGLLALLTVLLWYAAPWVGNISTQSAAQCPPARVCILVNDFLPADNTTAQIIAQDIQHEIEVVLDKAVADYYVLRTGAAVTDAETAKERAREDGYLLVVWGEVFEALQMLRIQFELADLLDVGESHMARAYPAQPLLYDPIGQQVECFNCIYADMTADVAQRTRIVAYTAAGLVDYVQGQPEQARFAFMAALYCAGEPVDATVIDLLQPDCLQPAGLSDWNPGLLYYYLGKALVLQGDYKRGIGYLEQAAEHNPYDPAAWIGIGSAYQSWLAQPDAPVAVAALAEAQTRAEKLLTDLPPSEWAPIYYDLGLIRELLGDTPGAQQHYAEAVKRFGKEDVSAYVALLSLARVQRASGALDAARQSTEQARDLDPSSPWAYLELAFLTQNEKETAEQMLMDAAHVAPNQAYTFITKAELCEKQWQDRDCAAAAYTQAIEQRPNSGWLHSRVGDFYLPTNPVVAGQSWEQAADHFQQAVTLRPNDPWAHERLAYVLYNVGNFASAAQHYARAIDLVYAETEAAALYCSLGQVQERDNLLDEAKQAYQHCKDLAASPQQRALAEELLAGLSK